MGQAERHPLCSVTDSKGKVRGGTADRLPPIYTEGICIIGAFFGAATEIVKDMFNNTMSSRKMAPAHPLYQLVNKSPSGDNGNANQMRV